MWLDTSPTWKSTRDLVLQPLRAAGGWRVPPAALPVVPPLQLTMWRQQNGARTQSGSESRMPLLWQFSPMEQPVRSRRHCTGRMAKVVHTSISGPSRGSKRVGDNFLLLLLLHIMDQSVSEILCKRTLRFLVSVFRLLFFYVSLYFVFLHSRDSQNTVRKNYWCVCVCGRACTFLFF